jgi:hypothetical protein
MVERRCRYCQQAFQPSKYQPNQSVCSRPECQRQRRTEYHRTRLAADADYAETCRESARKWRRQHSDYWKQYRQAQPSSAERNRQQQRDRDRKQRLIKLANNTSASDLKPCPAAVWLLGTELHHLANNNSAPAQVWVLEALPPRSASSAASCKQQRSGAAAACAG